MIDPHWSVVDLDPRTWRRLGRFFSPGQFIRAAQPGEHGLFVLHEGGRPLKIVDTRRGVRRDLPISDCHEAFELAHRLFATGHWERVHIVDKNHLANVARQAQATARRELTLDGYYHLVYDLLWGDADGYVCVPSHPGHWHGWTYDGIKRFVSHLPGAAALALGVFEGDAVAIGLILELHGGRVQKVTTFEALDLPPPVAGLSPEFLDRVWARLEEKFAPPAGVLLCTAPAFESWMAAIDKAGELERAAQEGTAHWRLRLADSRAAQE